MFDIVRSASQDVRPSAAGQCPHCQSLAARRSRTRNVQDVAARLLGKSVLRCRSCGERFHTEAPGERGRIIALQDAHPGRLRSWKWSRSARGRRTIRKALVLFSAFAALVLFLIGLANVGPS